MKRDKIMGETTITKLPTEQGGEAVDSIMDLQRLFPPKLRYTRQEIEAHVNDPGNLALFLLRDDKVSGYILAFPQDAAVEMLKMDDPLMRKDSQRYYIDQVAVKPDEHGSLEFLDLAYALLEELGRRGINRVSSHLLSANGLDKTVHEIFGPMSTECRQVCMPDCDDAPFLYMEVTYRGVEFGTYVRCRAKMMG